MTLEQIQQFNEKFQKQAVQLSELIPSGSLVQATSMLIRSAREIHDYFIKLLKSRSEDQFNRVMEKMEEEMDDLVFILDQLELANKKQQISLIEDFLKDGYGMMSIYSKCIDQIIDKKVHKEE